MSKSAFEIWLRGDAKSDIRDKLQLQNEFLENLIKYVRVTVACRKTGITLGQVNSWKRDDLMFRKRFEEAQDVSYDILEDEAIRRAFKGYTVPIIGKTGIIGHRRVYSDQLMIRILQARHSAYKTEEEKRTSDGMSQLLILPSNGRELNNIPQEAERFEIERENELDPIDELVERAKESSEGIFEPKPEDDET